MRRGVDAVRGGRVLFLVLMLAGRAAAQDPEKPSPFQYLEGHAAGIYAVAYSPDGKTLLSASLDGTVKVWDRETGQLIRTVTDSREGLLSLAVTKSGLEFAVAGLDGAIRVYDLPSRHPLAVMPNIPGAPTSMAVSGDGRLIVTGDQARYVRMWNPDNNQPLRDFGGSTEALTSVALIPETRTVLGAAKDGSLRGWNVDNAQLTGTVLTAPLNALAVHPEGKQLAAAGQDGLVRLIAWPPAPAQSIGTHNDQIGGVGMSPDGKWLASGGFDQQVHVYQASDGKHVRSLPGQAGKVTSLTFDANSKLLATSSDTGFLKFWQIEDGADRLGLAGHTGAVSSVAFHPGGTQVASAGHDGTVRIWVLPISPRTLAGHGAALQAVATSNDGTLAATSAADKTVRIWNVAEGKQVRAIGNLPQPATKIAFSADAKQIAFGDALGTLRIEPVADGGTPVLLGAHTAAITGLAFAPDAKALFSTAADGTLKSWQLPVSSSPAIDPHAEAVAATALSRDGKLAVTAARDGVIRVIDAATGKELRQWKLPAAPAVSLALSPDAKLVAVGDGAGRVRFWKTEDGSEVATIGGHAGEVHAVTFDAKQQHVATAGADGTARVWRIPAAPVSLAAHQKPVHAVSLSADGKRAVTVGADGLAQVWSLPEGKPQTKVAGEAALHCVAFRKDGAEFATGDATGVVRLVNAASGAIAGTVNAHEGPLTGLAYHPQQALLATAGTDGNVKLWKLPLGGEGEPVVFKAHEGGVAGVLFTADGNHLLSGGADKVVRLFDLTGKQVRQFDGCQGAVRCLALRGDNAQVAAGGDDQHVMLWRFDNGQVEKRVPTPAVVQSLSYSADHARLAAGGADHAVRILASADGTILEEIAGTVPAVACAYLPDGLSLLTVAAENGAVVRPVSLVHRLAAHQGAVIAVAWTPDGTGLVTGGADKGIIHWNVANGQQVRTFPGHQDAVTGLAVSGDGATLISASADRTLRTWTLANGAAVANIAQPTPIRRMATNDAATRVAAVGDDGLVRVWDLASGKALEHFTGHTGVVGAVAIDGEGRHVVSGGTDKTVRLWTVAAERVIAADPTKINDLALLPDGSHLLTAGDDKLVKQWDRDGKLVRQFGGSPTAVRSVAVSRDGTRVAAGGDPQFTQPNVFVWTLASGAAERTISTPAAVSALDFSPNGRLAVFSADKHLRIYSGEDGRLLEDITAPVVLGDLTFAGDKGAIVASGTDQNGYVLQSSLVRLMIGHEGAVTGVSWTPDGQRLVTAGADKTVRLWNAADGQPIAEFTATTAPVVTMALTGDGSAVLAALADNSVQEWPLPGKDAAKQIAPTRTQKQPAAVRALAGNAERLVLSGDDGLVRVIDRETGLEIERLAGHSGAVHSVAISADGRLLISGGADRVARRWVPTVTAVAKGHEGAALAVCFAPDEDRLYSAGEDGAVREWNIDPLEPAGVFEGAAGPVRCVTVSEDGLTLAAGNDKQVRIWKTENREPVVSLELPGVVTSLALGSDGRKVVVAASDAIVRNYGVAEVDGKSALVLTQEGHGHTGPVVAVALAGDGRTLYTAAADQTVRRWSAAAWHPRHELKGHQGPVYDLEYSPDDQRLASASSDGTVRMWNIVEGTPLLVGAGHQGQVNAVAFQPSGKELASAGADGRIYFWNAPPATPEAKKEGADVEAKPDTAVEPVMPVAEIVPEQSARLLTLTYSRDGNQVIAGGAGKSWCAWNRSDLKLVRTVDGHNEFLYWLGYNPAGNRLATLDLSAKLMLWNPGDGGLVFHQQLPAATAWSMAYSPDGTEILVGTAEARVLRVTLPPQAR